MLYNLDLTRVLFLDIETVPAFAGLDEAPAALRSEWLHKAKRIARWKEPEDLVAPEDAWKQEAGIYAEFGKIVCVSAGIVTGNDQAGHEVRMNSWFGDDEKQILVSFRQMLDKYYGNPNRHYLCGHNIREFDVPYLCRRYVIHGLELPKLLRIHGKKPWELQYLLDTMELWKFGDYKHYTRLSLLAALLGIPSPKDDMDGSEVSPVFWEEKDVEKIARYCERDVLTTIQIIRKYLREPLFEEDEVHTKLELPE